MKYENGKPCEHKGCLQHITHPCEGCGRNGGKERQSAQLEFSLSVNCPNCDEEIDLADGDYEGLYIKPIFNNKWNYLIGETVFCPNCDTEFQLGGVEY